MNNKPMLSNINFYTTDDDTKNIITNFNELKFNEPLFMNLTLSGIDTIKIDPLHVTILYYDKVTSLSTKLDFPEYQLNEVWQDTIGGTINIPSIDYDLKISDLNYARGLREYDFINTYQNIKVICTSKEIDFENMSELHLLNLMQQTHENEIFHTKVLMIPRSGVSYE